MGPAGIPAGLVLHVGDPADLAHAPTRSHLSDGRCVALVGPDAVGWVVDAELDLAPPTALAGRFGTRRFWERWTRAECAAKLTDVPVARWWSRHGLPDDPGSLPGQPPLELRTVRVPTPGRPDLVVSVGRVRVG